MPGTKEKMIKERVFALKDKLGKEREQLRSH